MERTVALHPDAITIHRAISPVSRKVILDHLGSVAAMPPRQAEVSAAFKQFTIGEAELRRCGRFVPGERARYVIAKAEAWILLAIFWDSMQSPIHDHDESDCGFRVIAGEVEETRFKVVEDGLVRPIATRLIHPGETAKSAAEAIHRLGLPRRKTGQSITLHVYCPILGFDAMGIYREIDSVEPAHETSGRGLV